MRKIKILFCRHWFWKLGDNRFAVSRGIFWEHKIKCKRCGYESIV